MATFRFDKKVRQKAEERGVPVLAFAYDDRTVKTPLGENRVGGIQFQGPVDLADGLRLLDVLLDYLKTRKGKK